MNNNPEWTSKYDTFDKDFILQEWSDLKSKINALKEAEMDLRKYIVKRAFPDAKEGMNTQELGNGYQLKAGVKFNYKLDSDNDKIWNVLDRIGKVGNQGAFVADRLVSWHPSFLLTEYRTLQEADDASSKEILKLIGEVLTIDEAAPSLEIKEPKGKKK